MNILLPMVIENKLTLEFIDLGGGLGIPYSDDETALDVERMAEAVTQEIKRMFRKHSLDLPKLILEPARYFVGDAGFLVGRIHGKKEMADGCLLGTDVSMNTLARPALYRAFHRIHVSGREGDPTSPFRFCGQVCENTDLWRREVQLPESSRVGDVIVLRDAGGIRVRNEL
ncbi:MAG: hypothetical protein WDO18_10495 [Acidobacteriota bacterium]